MRIFKSFGYAIAGIRSCIQTQPNFRIHILGYIFMNLSAWYIDFETWEYVVCTILSALVFSFELINTALEAAVDISSPEIQPLAKVAKDSAAASVFIIALCAVVVWLLIVCHHMC